jgi:hypothetical protein
VRFDQGEVRAQLDVKQAPEEVYSMSPHRIKHVDAHAASTAAATNKQHQPMRIK